MRLFTENRVLNSHYQHLFVQPNQEEDISPKETMNTSNSYWTNFKNWVGSIFHARVDHADNVLDSEITVECLAIK